MWLFPGASEDPEDQTVMEQYSTEELYFAAKTLMHAIWTEDKDSQQETAYRIIVIAKPWTISRWSESKLANGEQLVQLPMENALLVGLKLTEEE